MTILHPSAEAGFSKASATYAGGRPGYPPAIDTWLTKGLGLEPGHKVLDLGAGTGKFTAHLVEAGAAVTAVEPVAAMRETLRRALPTVPALDGTAAAIPLDDASVDAVVCAQSFHWFATQEALAEMARVLRPEGRLALVWNVRDEAVDWVAALTRIMAPYEAGTPRFRDGTWRRHFPGACFSRLQESRFSHSHCGPFERVVVDRTLSVSFIAALEANRRARVARQVRTLQKRYPALADPQGVAFPYETLAAWASKVQVRADSLPEAQSSKAASIG